MKKKLKINLILALSMFTVFLNSCEPEKIKYEQTIKVINRTTCTYDIFYKTANTQESYTYIETVNGGKTKEFKTSFKDYTHIELKGTPCTSCPSCSNGYFRTVKVEKFFENGEKYTLLIQ